MGLLINKLDWSNATWQGTWSDDTPIQYTSHPINAGPSSKEASVLEIFNSLPSPKPNPDILVDKYVQDAMRLMLKGKIRGLQSSTKMHPYQLRTAAMMLQRETQPGFHIDPRLRQMKDQAGNFFYHNLDRNAFFKEPRFYEAPRGGICAENMGLGKTLICLALILSTKDFSSQIPVEHSVGSIPVRRTTGSLVDMVASSIGRFGLPVGYALSQIESEGGTEFRRIREALARGAGYYWYTPNSPGRESRNKQNIVPKKIWLTKATLVVVPSNLVQQWVQEIKKHTSGLNYLVMDNPITNLPAAEVLATYDIILFSKRRFAKEATDQVSSTPLKDLHFKRLITDEGHAFGNASRSSKTEVMTVVDFLHLDARWIISGTPTQGLHGSEFEDSPFNDFPDLLQSPDAQREKVSIDQEIKDLGKLGNILSHYLKARPWANTMVEQDQASWSSLVIKPRYKNDINRDSQILVSTLKSMIVRHTVKDIQEQLSLPPLYKNIVYLDGCFQNKLSLNVFSVMIVINAVTSEREGEDYLFHPKSKQALRTLVSNLRQASFIWSGYTIEMISSSLKTAKKFLAKEGIIPGDRELLERAIKVGELALTNGIFTAVSRLHEMAMYIKTPLPKEMRRAWALDYQDSNPMLMGATMVLGAQQVFPIKYPRIDRAWLRASRQFGEHMMQMQESENVKRGGKLNDGRLKHVELDDWLFTSEATNAETQWMNSTILSTASSKLSYLLDQVSLHHKYEKIIIFYEAENVGYYIAQALKCINIQCLLYSKRDTTSERSKCVVDFNILPEFRVMLMDVGQAAFGLDMSAASRVYFVDPVFSPQTEAQAIKRAHRIGQLRPVYVETLILRGSIEEEILTRRDKMTDQEHMRLGSILDDDALYKWIKNVPFYDIPGEISGPDQMARVTQRHTAFLRTNLEHDREAKNTRTRNVSERPRAALPDNDIASTNDSGLIMDFDPNDQPIDLFIGRYLPEEVTDIILKWYKVGLNERRGYDDVIEQGGLVESLDRLVARNSSVLSGAGAGAGAGEGEGEVADSSAESADQPRDRSNAR